ncbi:MAG: histidine phosphatase family protein [Candidatus Thermoplasmatota archaeon]|nr:histidine phosphatase family protein [Candidatus Thermoplasmatota archaeon]
MRKFIAVRHGESEANRLQIFSDHENKYPLTDEGRTQVENSAMELRGVMLDGVISSPVLRARETAEILADRLKLDLSVDTRLRESKLGRFNERRIIPMNSSRRREFGLESWESQLDRMLSCVNSRDGSYIIVSHASPIRALVCQYIGIKHEDPCLGIEIRYSSMSMVLCESHQVLTIGALKIDDEIRKEFNAG